MNARRTLSAAVIFFLYSTHAFAAPNSEVFQSTPTSLTISLQSIFPPRQALAPDISALASMHNLRVGSIYVAPDSILHITYTISVPATGELRAELKNLSYIVLDSSGTGRTSFVQPAVRVSRIGIMRGYSVASVDISLEYKGSTTSVRKLANGMTVNISWQTPLDKPLWRDDFAAKRIANHEWVNPFFNKTVKQTSKPNPASLQSKSSVNQVPLSATLLVNTTKDGIARITGKDILQLQPKWREISTSSLHLYSRNQVEQPLLTFDTDGSLGEDDTLYFVGSHARGDTTWMSTFTWNEGYALTVDSSSPGKRYTQNPPRKADTVTSLRRLLHIEEEHDYCQAVAKDVIRYYFKTENVEGERWYWQEVKNFQPFSYRTHISPTGKASDTIECTVHYVAINDNDTLPIDQFIRLQVNKKTMDKQEFNGIAEMDITARLSSDSIPAGGLEINQTSYDATNMVQIVDYIRIKGVQNAIASSNRFDAVDTLAQQVNVRVHGFTHPDILTLDSMSRTASRSIGKRGYTVRCGASSSSMIWNTITIGDSIVFASDTIGVTVVIISPNGSITTLSQRDVSDNLINTIRTSVDGSLIVLSSNSANDIGTNLKALLISSGLTVIGNVLPGHCYAAAYIKGTSRIFESTSPTVASLSEFIESENANSYQALIPLSQGAVHPVIGAGTGIEQAQVRPVNTVDLRSPDLYAKNIIITHKSFASQAQRLADFHTSKGDTSIVVDVDDIYIQFGSYQKTPHAIKYFLRYAYTSWMKPAPEYVTIFGDASWDPRMIPPHGRMVDYVPSYGKPVSDFWYTLLDGNDQIPEMNVGRITVDTPEEARNYVDKIFEMDTIPPQQFDKRFLLMSAGIGKNEEQTFYETNVEGVSKFIDWQDGQTLCGDTVIYARYRTMPTGFSESSFIKSTINSGVSWVNFIGHAAPTVFEISGWDEKQLANAGRYPILSTFSCQSGAFAERDVLTLNEAYIRPPRRGMIGAIGTTGYGITTTDREIQLLIFEQLSIRGIRNVGEVLSRAKSTFIERYGSIMSVADRNVIDQTLLLGDPLYRIRIDTLPHPYTQERDVFIRNSTGNTFITEDDDSAHVQIVIRNAGMFARQPIPVRIIHSYNGVADTTNLSLIDFCKFDVLSFSFVAKEQPGDHKIIIHIDPDNRLRFSNTVRRVYEYTSYIYAPLPLALDPFPGWTVDATAPRFRFINPLSSTSSFDYECRLVRNRDSLLLSEVKAKDQRTLRIDSTFVEWKPSVSLTANTEHHFSVRLIDNIKNKISPWLTIPVKPVESLQTGIVRITHNTSEDWKLYSYTGLVPDSLRPHTLAMRYYIPFRIYGATGAGYQDNNGQYVPLIERAYTLNIQGRTYSDERNDKAGRWHVRTLPRHDTIVRVATDFFTREHKPRTEISNDSMYKEFMRDSILDDEYVFVVTNERWWSWMDGDTTYKSRYFNDIKPAFRSLGAKLIDTLEPPQAYAFVGMRSAFPYRNFEAVRFDTGYKRADTTEIRGSVKISPRFGELRSPIFGPASSWKSVTIHGRFPDTSCTVTIVVEGRSNPTSNPVELAVVKSPVIRLDSLNAKLYRYISFRLLIDRKSYASDAEIDSVTVEFEPPVELAAQPSSLRVSPTSVLRGDTTIQSAVMKLISPRTNTLPQLQSTMTYTPVRGNWQPISRVFNVENVNPDVELMITDTMPTLNQSTETQVAFTLNQNASVDDFYSFNNRISTTAYVQDDTVKPVIRLFIDSNEVKDDEVVAMSSSFRVMVYDNANLPVDDTSLVRAIVNLPVNKQRDPDLRYYNTKDAKAIFGSEVQLRQGMSFSRMLEIGTNNITVTANDIFGNTAVLKRVVRVSDRIDIESPVVQPNPIETHSAAIKYVYRGQQRNAPVTVNIFDVNGKILRTLYSNATLGDNTLEFETKDNDGKTFSQGMYYFRIWLDELGVDVAPGGMFAIVR